MISYAQNYEDVMLYRVFRDRPSGFYVDAGAGNPVMHSVTKWFYDQGWQGINIEPHPDFFRALQQDRPRDINLNCGAGATSGDAPFFVLPTEEWSSFDRSVQQRAEARHEAVNVRETEIRTLNEIIEEHAHGRPIDFLKIDVEGWELQVLRGLDLTRHRPTVIVVEATHQGSPEPNYGEWEGLLTGAGYPSVYFDGLNKFYLAEEKKEFSSHFATPPNVFDDFKTFETVQLRQLLDETSNGVQNLASRLKQSEDDRALRLEHINALSAQLKQSEGDRARRLEQIDILTAQLKRSEEDRALRLEQIHRLTDMVHAAERRADKVTQDS